MALPPNVTTVAEAVAYFDGRDASRETRLAALEAAVTPTPGPTLAALSLAANTITENSASGTVVGGIIGKTAGSTLSLANDDGGRFAISGTNLVAGLTNIDYEAATSRSIVLRETLAGATNSPRDTPLAVGVVNVFEQPSLRALLLSSTSLTIGTPATGTITEAATGSTITSSGLPAGFTVNGSARTWAYDGSGPASTPTITLTETLGDSPNSPRATSIGLTVAAASVAPFTIAFAGSSTPEFGITNGGSVANGDDRVLVTTNGGAFSRLNTGDMAQTLGKLLADSTGRVIRFISTAKAGTTLAQWESDTDSRLTACVNAINAAGGCDAMYLQVGSNDVYAGNPTSKAVHLALLRSLIAKIRTRTNLSQLMIFIGVTQDKNFTPELSYVRQAEMEVVNNDPFVRFGVNNGAFATIDGTHLNDVGYMGSARLIHPQIDAFARGLPQKRGPIITSAVRVSDTATDVTVQSTNGSDITPSTGIVGFDAYDGGGTRLTGVTAARQAANVIRVTHPAGAATVTFYNNPLETNAADTNYPRDNSPSAFPMEPTATRIAIAGAGTITPVAISGTPGTATAGSAYSFVPTVTGGDGTRVFAGSGTLPAGFVFSTATGSVTATAGNAAAAGTYAYAITVTSGGTSATLNISIIVQAAAGGGAGPTGKSAIVDHTQDGATTPTGYNRHTVAASTTATPLQTPSNAATGWTGLQSGGAVSAGATGATTGNDSGIYKDAALMQFWFQSNGISTSVYEFAGLDDAKAYDIYALGSRTAPNRATKYWVNGDTSTTQNLLTSDNTANRVRFQKVRPVGGKITLTWQSGTAADGSTSPNPHLNVSEIVEFAL